MIYHLNKFYFRYFAKITKIYDEKSNFKRIKQKIQKINIPQFEINKLAENLKLPQTFQYLAENKDEIFTYLVKFLKLYYTPNNLISNINLLVGYLKESKI